jgi:FkbM family methyltransferase
MVRGGRRDRTRGKMMEIKTASPAPNLSALLGLSCTIKVVDIGASPIDGPAPYATLLVSGCADVVGFEPNAESLAKLNQQKGSRETYLPCVVGDGRQHTLHVCWSKGMTSLLPPNPEVLSLITGFSSWGKVVQTELVQTKRLDEIPETAALDYLKMDIQGAELMVLQHATNRLRHAVVIHTEVEFLPMYVGQPLFSDIDQFLRQHGFVLHRFNPLTTRAVVPLSLPNKPYDGYGQLFWADAVFIKDFTRPDQLDADQLLRLAIILHDCYAAYDVVAHLLLARDRRIGSDLGDRYVRLATGARAPATPRARPA